MRFCKIVLCVLIVGIALPTISLAEDLFDKTRSDTAIKMYHFPQSMTVLQNRPGRGLYYFYNNGEARFNEGLGNAPEPEEDGFDTIVSDAGAIKKTLVKTDPARVAPSKAGEDVRGPITRKRLLELAKANSSDILLIFRRDVQVHSESVIPASSFSRPASLVSSETGGYTMAIRTRGILYLKKQKKVLVLKDNKQSETVSATDLQEGSAEEKIRAINLKGLKRLANEARRVILSHKFEVRRSGY